MKKTIIGTEIVGPHNRIKTTGILREMGIKEFHSLEEIDLSGILAYLLSVESEEITEHTHRFGKYMLKFYPPQSFGFLAYCQKLGLPVENPLAMGINERNEGDILIVDRIEGKDYREIILQNRRNIFFQRIIPRQEMEALGRLVYLFCSQGIFAGDSKLQNFMYDGEKAIRIDLIPQNDSISDINWGKINKDIEKAYGKEDEFISMLSDIHSMLRDAADILTHQPQSGKRFLQNLGSFLKGFANDELSKIIAPYLWEYAREITNCMQRAEKASQSFQEMFWSDVKQRLENGEPIKIRRFEH